MRGLKFALLFKNIMCQILTKDVTDEDIEKLNKQILELKMPEECLISRRDIVYHCVSLPGHMSNNSLHLPTRIEFMHRVHR